MNFFDIIRDIYLKSKRPLPKIDIPFLIPINHWLSYDRNNLPYLKRVLPYLFYIEPIHYFYLLYFNIPKTSRVPFLKKIEKEKIIDDKLLSKIQYVMKWSNKELNLNKPILEKVLTNKKYWENEVGIQKVRKKKVGVK